MGGALTNHLGVYGATLRGGVWRRLRVDPETIDAHVVRAGLVVGYILRVQGIGDAILSGFTFTFLSFEDHILLCNFDILAIGEGEIEIVQPAAVQHEGSVALLA